MGGAYGHIDHPFQDLDLTFAKLLEMVELIETCSFDSSHQVYEKTDGLNLFMTIKNGGLLFARSKGELKGYGDKAKSASELLEKFNHSKVVDVYSNAIKYLSNKFNSVNGSVFKEGEVYLSLEIIHPLREVTVPYNRNVIIPHGFIKVDYDGNVVDYIREVNLNFEKDEYSEWMELQPITFNRIDRIENNHFGKRLFEIIADSEMKFDNTISDYLCKMWEPVVADRFGLDSDHKYFNAIVRRMALGEKNPSLTKMKSELDTIAIKKFEQSAEKLKIHNQITFPLESLFAELGSVTFNQFANWVPIAQDVDECSDKFYEKVIRFNKITIDNNKLDDFIYHQCKLLYHALYTTDCKLLPLEGITFVFDGKMYKLTGAFTPIHKLLGLVRFNEECDI